MFNSKFKNFLKIVIINFFFVSGIQSNVSKYTKFPDLQESKEFLNQFISPGDLVFDVGAHIGKKTDIYRSLGARVICFEPQPECIQQLIKKFKYDPNVVIVPIGLADKQGNFEFYICSQANTISTYSYEYTQKGRFAENNYTWDEKIIVPVHTLDAMIEKYGAPHFCKIDVENYEYEVLKGLSKPISCISFECNSEWLEESTHKCIIYLLELGYKKFNFGIAERGVWLFSEWLTAELFFQKLVEAAADKKWTEIGGLWGDVYAQYE